MAIFPDQPALEKTERDCPCGNSKLNISKHPSGGFVALHFEPGNESVESGTGCSVAIRFSTIAELDDVLENWPT